VSDLVLGTTSRRHRHGHGMVTYPTVQYSTVSCSTPRLSRARWPLGACLRKGTTCIMLVRLHPRPVGATRDGILTGFTPHARKWGPVSLFNYCLIVYFGHLCRCFDRPIPGCGVWFQDVVCVCVYRYTILLPAGFNSIRDFSLGLRLHYCPLLAIFDLYCISSQSSSLQYIHHICY
jgi:hypothetical protein